MTSRQLELFSDLTLKDKKNNTSQSPDEAGEHQKRICGFLSVVMSLPADVVFTNNKKTMVSATKKMGRYKVRLHSMFLKAENNIIAAVASYLEKGDKQSSLILSNFIESNKNKIYKTKRKSSAKKINPTGKHHDLKEVFLKINAKYFNGEIDVKISWGRKKTLKSKKRRKSGIVTRALASYYFDESLIRVNPVLDGEDIPEYVLGWIIYHEILHHVLPVEHNGKQNRYHTAKFKMLERAFEHYDKAKNWEEKNISRLLE